jgi:lysophospholipase L1-like esterase
MKKCMLLLLTGSAVLMARESNLINNSAFGRGLLHWNYEGSGQCRLLNRKPVFSDGVLYHYFDLGNTEHADPECGRPVNRVFRFRIKAKGRGTFRLGVRARLMPAGNALELRTHWSPDLQLSEQFRNYDFEAMETHPDTVFHDKLLIESRGEITVSETWFYYPDRNEFSIDFTPECAVVRPGQKVKTIVRTSLRNRKLTVDVYCGQTVAGGYDRSVRRELVTGPDGRAELSFTVPYAATDGVRAAVSDPVSGVRKSFFANLMTGSQMKRMSRSASLLSGKKHLLFLGDSLTDYDRGRNYPSLISCFLPAGWTFRNAGVGGDDLRKIHARLTGGKVNRPEMFEKLFAPMPDIIFLLCGGNDTKVSFRSGYRKNETPEELQAPLLDRILSELKKRAPEARIVLISPLDSYQPSQKALAEPLVKAGINHNYFGDPVQIGRFTEKMKLAAQKHGAEFCDAGSVFRSAEDLQQLHVPDDGVHLSLRGHQLMAEIILDYISRTNSK